ncbi:uncharacterized protein LOC114194825 [Vigna unguiculata]|uniref:uncharacterized protein LOC114194825 n=1 Tax=Vigna unguiculata TaxID=3917 RepID=UPI001016D6D6|nr:uncharacterized protein LOC114194825 [Vigna unguiculata]
MELSEDEVKVMVEEVLVSFALVHVPTDDVYIAAQENLQPNKIPHSLEDPLGALLQLAQIIDDKPMQNEISEGHVYAIQNFSVAPNSGIYRTTHHPYKINFQFGTKVSLLNVNFVPDMKPQYTPLSLLTTTAFDTDYLVDILGLLVRVGTERELQVDGKTTKLNVIAIEADGYFISILY